MKLLVPVDGSENSLRAIQYVLKMAKTHPSMEVILLTAACPTDIIYFATDPFIGTSGTQVYQQCESTFSEKLAAAKKIFDEAGIPVKAELIHGDPAQTIISYIEDKGIDKVVMGSRGLSPLKGIVFGSVTYKVLSNVKIPVTVVK